MRFRFVSGTTVQPAKSKTFLRESEVYRVYRKDDERVQVVAKKGFVRDFLRLNQEAGALQRTTLRNLETRALGPDEHCYREELHIIETIFQAIADKPHLAIKRLGSHAAKLRWKVVGKEVRKI